MRKSGALALSMVVLAVGPYVVRPQVIDAQNRPAAGILAGTVTADRGDVRALRVKATDTVHKMSYTVFTNKGEYRIHNLPASTYSVAVLEEEFSGPAQTVDVKAGQTQTVNLATTFKQMVVQGAGSAGAAAQANYGATMVRQTADGEQVELVDFDVIYPPSPTREVMIKNCFTCHGPSGWHGRPRTEAQWRRGVHKMFTVDGQVAGMAPGVPQLTYDRVTPQQEEDIIKYLTANFGPGSKRRDLKVDKLVRDENELSQALYVQYDSPPATGKPFAMIGPYGGPPSRSLHSAWVSVAKPGIVYMSGNRSNSIAMVDTRNLDPNTRFKEFMIDNPQNLMTQPHGLFDQADGKVWFVELSGDRVDMLDPDTGKLERYKIPTEGGGPHSIWPDSKGNFYYTYFASAGKIGRFDSRAKAVKEYDVPKGLSGYGIVTDKQDRAWAVSLNMPVILGFDPKTDKWTTYNIPVAARRLAIDSKGMVWAAGYFGNNIIMLDPSNGKVTEYTMPLKYGNPYDLWPDQDDNIWIENAVYNSLVKFEPKTKKFTYFPFPVLRGHTPKLDRDHEGTFWFTLGRPSTLTAFKPRGNVALKGGATQ